MCLIRPLTAEADLEEVVALYTAAPDYWELAEGKTPGPDKAAAFFTDGPPGCDPAEAERLGLYEAERLTGLAELSFGFPAPGDAYLGFMMLGPWARGRGLGRRFLRDVENRARARRCPALYLAVLEANPRARAFWEREGFAATGVSGSYPAGGRTHHLHRLAKPL